LRSLVLLPNLPFPIRQGLDLRAWTVIDALTSLGPVAVFGVRHDAPAPPPLPAIDVWTSSQDESLTARDPGAQLAWLADPDGNVGDAYFSERAGVEVAALVASFAPDVVLLLEVRLHRYLDVIDRTRSVVVLDSPSIESTLQQQLADPALSPNRAAAMIRRRAAQRIAAAEDHLFDAVDQVWACSQHDASVMSARVPKAAISVVPNTVDVDRYANTEIRSPRLQIVFPAMFAFPPNEAAALTLIHDVLPIVREAEPDAELVLVGSHSTPRLTAASGEPGVNVQGTIDDIRPVLAGATTMAVPLTVASGTRYKLLEAFASRLPVVSTALGAEGLDVEDGVHLRLAEDASAFADAILRIWRSRSLAAELTASAHDLVRTKYSFNVSRRAAARALNGTVRTAS
jgi:glycosyltransferase involved in cell wall biosynthesis